MGVAVAGDFNGQAAGDVDLAEIVVLYGDDRWKPHDLVAVPGRHRSSSQGDDPQDWLPVCRGTEQTTTPSIHSPAGLGRVSAGAG